MMLLGCIIYRIIICIFSDTRYNRLLRSVEADLCVPELIAGCKALGLIDKLVTGLFWRTLEESNISILKMSDKYAEMECKFIAWSVDSSMLLTGDESLFGDTLVH